MVGTGKIYVAERGEDVMSYIMGLRDAWEHGRMGRWTTSVYCMTGVSTE